MQKTEADLTLENEQLDQYLETAPPASQPVVVVQYRNRGVPSWVFFPLLLFVPLGALGIYHRLVVVPTRAQATEARRVAETLSDQPRSGGSLPGNDRPSPAAAASRPEVVVQVGPGPSVPPADPVTSPSASSATPVAIVPDLASPATAVSPPGPPNNLADGAKKPADPLLAARTDPPSRSDAAPPARPGENAAAGGLPQPRPGETTAAGGGEKAGTQLRSVLPNPFAPDGAPAASTKRETGALAGGSDPSTGPVGVPPNDGRGRSEPLEARVRDARPSRPGDGDGPGRPGGLQPLPSREESMRQIEEEAARKKAEILAQEEARETEVRTRRFDDRVKFHEELKEILKTHTDKAGPEIDKLGKRYGFDAEQERLDQAYRIWVYGRGMSQATKVQQIRLLDVPEMIILNFMSDDLHKVVRTRKGPRNENEVRIKAAQQLLRFPPPAFDPARPPGAGTGTGGRPPRAPVRPLAPSGKGAGPRLR